MDGKVLLCLRACFPSFAEGVFYVDFYAKKHSSGFYCLAFLDSHPVNVWAACATKKSEQKKQRKDIKLISKTCRSSLAAFPRNLNSIFKLLSRDAAREFLFLTQIFCSLGSAFHLFHRRPTYWIRRERNTKRQRDIISSFSPHDCRWYPPRDWNNKEIHSLMLMQWGSENDFITYLHTCPGWLCRFPRFLFQPFPRRLPI